jgi:hypothetical protein
MAIAEHDPSKLYTRNRGMLNMTHTQLHDFASGSEKGKPQYAKGSKRSGKQGLGHPERNLGPYHGHSVAMYLRAKHNRGI